jgi:hypothetical protein
VCAQPGAHVDPDAPDPLQFNHCIVAIAWPGAHAPRTATVPGVTGKEWTFFDPTDAGTPLGSISTALGGTWGVIADPGEGLVRLPPATHSVLIHEVRGRLAANGDLRGELRLHGEGPEAEAMALAFGSLSDEQRLARARRFLDAKWPRATIDSCRFDPGRPAAPRGTIAIDFLLPGVARAAGRDLLFMPPLVTAWPGAPPRDSARTLPLLLGPVAVIEEHWEIELPSDLAPELRTPARWQGAIGEYSSACGGEIGRLTLDRRLDLRSGEIPAGQFAEARALWRTVYSGDRPSVLLDRR